jgi:Zn-dependent protease with chaperone function
MIEWLASSTLMLFALWILFGIALRVVYPLFKLLITRISAAQGSLLLLLYLSLPLVASGWLVLSMYWPDVARWLVVEHCHSGLCQPHGPVNELAVWPALILGIWIVGRLVGSWRRFYLPARKLLKQLNSLGISHSEFIELPENSVAAFTVGILRSKVFLSRGLLALCTDQDVKIIIAHEQAHQRRFDNLRRIIAGLLVAPLPQTLTRTMLNDHQLLCEQACDDMAAESIPRESVAETVLKVARLQSRTPEYASAFADSHTRLRIEALLKKSGTPIPEVLLYVGSFVALGLFLTLVDPLHHLLEWLH